MSTGFAGPPLFAKIPATSSFSFRSSLIASRWGACSAFFLRNAYELEVTRQDRRAASTLTVGHGMGMKLLRRTTQKMRIMRYPARTCQDHSLSHSLRLWRQASYRQRLQLRPLLMPASVRHQARCDDRRLPTSSLYSPRRVARRVFRDRVRTESHLLCRYAIVQRCVRAAAGAGFDDTMERDGRFILLCTLSRID